MTGNISERLPNETHERHLSAVSSDDLFNAAFYSDDDDLLRSRWLDFMEEQPVLAQEILDSLSFLVEDPYKRQQVINQVTLVYRALKEAIGRGDGVS